MEISFTTTLTSVLKLHWAFQSMQVDAVMHNFSQMMIWIMSADLLTFVQIRFTVKEMKSMPMDVQNHNVIQIMMA